MVYSVVCEGVIECSNTLEDEEDAELLPQALVYKPCRQHIYGLLLHGHDARTVNLIDGLHTYSKYKCLRSYLKVKDAHAHSQRKHISKTHADVKVDTHNLVY